MDWSRETLDQMRGRLAEIEELLETVTVKARAVRLQIENQVNAEAVAVTRTGTPYLAAVGRQTPSGLVIDWEVPDQPSVNTERVYLDPLTRKCSWCSHRHSVNFTTVRNDSYYRNEMPPAAFQSCLACESKLEKPSIAEVHDGNKN